MRSVVGSFHPLLLSLALPVVLLGCSDAEPATHATVQQVRTGAGGMLGLELLITDPDGGAIACDAGELEVSLAVSRDGGGTFEPADAAALHLACTDPGQGELALVVDNSGSQEGYLPQLQQGARGILGGVLDAGGRASLVRVSTNASVEVALTDDTTRLDTAIDAMFTANGWTALYDGVRVGNETLGGAVVSADEASAYPDAASFCAASRRQGIVVFTDGRENNSADQLAHEYDAIEYPGDGLDTTLEDLHNLRVADITTPIYTIGLGAEPDHAALAALAAHTGGRHRVVDTPDDLPDVFELVGEYFGASHQVCADLGVDSCGETMVRLEYRWSDGVDTVTERRELTVHVPCETPPAEGKSATILLTLSDPGVPAATAGTLAAGTARWVSPVAAPRVLVVRDDNHHGEDPGDPAFIRDLLAADGLDATLLDEPADGLSPAMLAAHDVVWLVNPGYPVDDLQTIDSLRAHLAHGGGVVLSGDDMSAAWAKGFDMSGMTHLDHVDNGVKTCGKKTNDNRGASFRIDVLPTPPHPITAGLEGASFTYGNDLDHTTPRGEGERVLAWARLDGEPSCDLRTPAIVAYEP